MRLRIRTTKTETLRIGEQVDFHINGHRLIRVDMLTSNTPAITSKDCKLDEEITARVQAASCVMGRSRDTVFNCRDS